MFDIIAIRLKGKLQKTQQLQLHHLSPLMRFPIFLANLNSSAFISFDLSLVIIMKKNAFTRKEVRTIKFYEKRYFASSRSPPRLIQIYNENAISLRKKISFHFIATTWAQGTKTSFIDFLQENLGLRDQHVCNKIIFSQHQSIAFCAKLRGLEKGSALLNGNLRS